MTISRRPAIRGGKWLGPRPEIKGAMLLARLDEERAWDALVGNAITRAQGQYKTPTRLE